MKPYILEETNWKELKNKPYDVAVIPWGATEPHNYHLPYGTDNLISSNLAALAAEKAGVQNARIMVLPTIAFGVQNPGQIELPFCLHVSPSTQKMLFADIVKALYNQGIKKIVILNGHGGNDFKPLIREVQADFPKAFLGLLDWFRVPGFEHIFEETGDHADETETSLIQYFSPELVRPLNEAGDGACKAFKLEGLKSKVAWTPRNWQQVSEDTGVGNPKKATPEKGKKCVEFLTEKISDFFVELAQADLDDLYE